MTSEKLKDRTEAYVRTLYPGMYFGEVAILTNTMRTACVRSRNYTMLGLIEASYFDELLLK